jgi:hypothetical protein
MAEKGINKADLETLRDELEKQSKSIEDKLTQVQKDLYMVKVIVAGNGDPSKSLVLRFDRLEQAAARRAWLVNTALGASISSIIGVIAFLIKHLF